LSSLIALYNFQDINIGQQLISLEHAVYIDGEESTRQEDEGIGINEVFDSSAIKSDIETVMEEVVQNIVDQSIVHSLNKPSMKNEQKIENLSSPNPLNDTPIKLPSCSSTVNNS
jgi:hypothetical protein